MPIEVITSGLPNLKQVRTVSLYGLSDVKLQFGFEFTYQEAEQQVLNRLAQLDQLPNNAKPAISPVSPIGEIFRYKLAAPAGYSVLDLKTLQDWVLRRRFRAVPGVIDVIGWGGKTKTFEVNVDLDRLTAYGLTLANLTKTLTDSNLNVGGDRISLGSQSAVVRGVGLIRSVDDIEQTVLTSSGGAPVLVRDVASVTIGHQPRLGIAGMNEDDDIVQGIVLMRRGEKSTPTIQAVENEVRRIEAAGILPPGVRIERIYDRSDLIEVTTHTVLHNMVFGIALILAIQWLFLGNLRSALIVVATIPFALFFAVVILVVRDESANLLSVGALDFGLIVDGTVIMVESIFRRLSGHGTPVSGHAGAPLAATGLGDKMRRIVLASSDVSRSIAFAAVIIITGVPAALHPHGGRGPHLRPDGADLRLRARRRPHRHLHGDAGAVGLPAARAHRGVETLLVRTLDRLYRPVVRAAVANRVLTLGLAALVFGGVAVTGRGLGLEFLPKLEEGNLWLRATMPATISLAEGNTYVNRIRRIMAEVPEIERVVSQHGRPDDGTDAAGFYQRRVLRAPQAGREVAAGRDQGGDAGRAARQAPARVPRRRVQRLAIPPGQRRRSGLGHQGRELVQDLRPRPPDPHRHRPQGRGVAQDDPRRHRPRGVHLARPADGADQRRPDPGRPLRADPGDINSTVRTAIGGDSAGDLYDGGSDRHYPMIVRLASQFRQSVAAIRNLRITGQGANGPVLQLPLSSVATVELVSGPAYIYREGQERYLPVKFSVRDRDLGSTIIEAREKSRPRWRCRRATGSSWSASSTHAGRPGAAVVTVPLAIGLIAILLFMNFNSIVDTLLALSVIPMAVAGGILGLALTATPFSVSAAIGFIALLGIAVMDGIIVISHYNGLVAAGEERVRAMLRTCHTQMRPVVMTCVVAGVGLLPAAFSSGVGSQVQKPLALVVVGGMALAPLLILLILRC